MTVLDSGEFNGPGSTGSNSNRSAKRGARVRRLKPLGGDEYWGVGFRSHVHPGTFPRVSVVLPQELPHTDGKIARVHTVRGHSFRALDERR